MADIEYDAGDASALSSTLRTAAGVLRGQAFRGGVHCSAGLLRRLREAVPGSGRDRGGGPGQARRGPHRLRHGHRRRQSTGRAGTRADP
jgi:hypothetical protein